MGQFALGIRSLLVKFAVFVVMAALLAWALGGTLFPRPARVNLNPVSFNGVRWYWRLSVRHQPADSFDSFDRHVRWELMRQPREGEAQPFQHLEFTDVAGTVRVNGRLYFAGFPYDPYPSSTRSWFVAALDETGGIIERESMPDR